MPVEVDGAFQLIGIILADQFFEVADVGFTELVVELERVALRDDE